MLHFRRVTSGILFLRYCFEDCVLDTDRRELRRKGSLVAVEPQVFDLLVHLRRHRERVVTKDDLLAAVWQGRIVSESALANRINAARGVIGDTGNEQRLIKTLPRRGVRFVGAVREDNGDAKVSPLDLPNSTSEAFDCGIAVSYTSEVPYVFGNNAHPFLAGKVGDGPRETSVARATMQIWSTFARTGKPETVATGAWPVYSAERRAVGVIGGDNLFRIEVAPRDAELRVWDAMYRV